MHDALNIYESYPRHVAKRYALNAINKAIERLKSGEVQALLMTTEEAIDFLLKATCEYAQSPAGNRGLYTPHPSTWFAQSRYLDDRREWEKQTAPSEKELEQMRSNMRANVGVYKPT